MRLITAPTSEPVTLAEVKAAARIAGTTDFDAMLPGLITAARQIAEQTTGRWFMAQTRRAELVDWPSSTTVHHAPEATAVTVSYWTGSTWQAVSADAYTFGPDPLDIGTLVAPITGTSWPTLGELAVGPRVRLTFTAGAALAADVPECVKLYIKALVAWWIDNPAACAKNDMQEAPYLSTLLDSQRLWA